MITLIEHINEKDERVDITHLILSSHGAVIEKKLLEN